MKSFKRCGKSERETPLFWNDQMKMYQDKDGNVPMRCYNTTWEHITDLYNIIKRKGIIEALKYDWRSTIYPRDAVESLRRW